MSILSIQSHIVYGYVGNTAAVFALQRLGYEVWAMNTVEFSNNTGYNSWKGRVLGSELVYELTRGLQDRGILNTCKAVLSGYLGDAEIGKAVMDTVRTVRKEAPKVIYCCDPVMGDYGRGFYVRKGIPDLIQEQILPLADIITPNQFELEALSGIRIRSLEDTKRALDILHQRGPKIILVTSYKDADTKADHIDMLVSDNAGYYRVCTPEIPFNPSPSGTGDLSSAIFLAHYLENNDPRASVEAVAASIYGILDATYKSGERELRLIQAQDELVHPSHSFRGMDL